MSWSFPGGPTDFTDRHYAMSPGAAPPDGGPITMAVLVKPIAAYLSVFNARKAGTGGYGILADSGEWFTDNDFGSGALAVDQNVWEVIVSTKTSGSAPNRWHKASGLGGTVSWTHVDNAFTAIPDGPNPVDEILLFANVQPMRGFIAALALWDTLFDDSQVEALGVTSMDNWLAASPQAAWQFNTDPALPLHDLTAGGANQISQSGNLPTLSTDDPPGWAYHSASPSFDPRRASAFLTFF